LERNNRQIDNVCSDTDTPKYVCFKKVEIYVPLKLYSILNQKINSKHCSIIFCKQ